MEWYITYIERGQSKISFIVGAGLLWPAGPEGSQHRAFGLCTPFLCCSRVTLAPPLQSLKYWKLVHACGLLTYTRKQYEGTLTEQETGKDSPHKAESLLQAVWALYVLIRKCSRPKALSYLAEQGSKDCLLTLPFPTMTKSTWKLWLARYRNPNANRIGSRNWWSPVVKISALVTPSYLLVTLPYSILSPC